MNVDNLHFFCMNTHPLFKSTWVTIKKNYDGAEISNSLYAEQHPNMITAIKKVIYSADYINNLRSESMVFGRHVVGNFNAFRFIKRFDTHFFVFDISMTNGPRVSQSNVNVYTSIYMKTKTIYNRDYANAWFNFSRYLRISQKELDEDRFLRNRRELLRAS